MFGLGKRGNWGNGLKMIFLLCCGWNIFSIQIRGVWGSWKHRQNSSELLKPMFQKNRRLAVRREHSVNSWGAQTGPTYLLSMWAASFQPLDNQSWLKSLPLQWGMQNGASGSCVAPPVQVPQCAQPDRNRTTDIKTQPPSSGSTPPLSSSNQAAADEVPSVSVLVVFLFQCFYATHYNKVSPLLIYPSPPDNNVSNL